MLELVSAAVAVVAAVVSTIQLIAVQRVSRNEVGSEAMRDFWAPEARKHRATVWTLEGRALTEWSEDERWTADLVATRMSYMGLLFKNRYASSEAFLNFYAPWCVAAFRILSPFVAEKRREYNSPDQWIYFEWLARTAEVHLRRRSWWTGRSWQRLKRQTAAVPDPDLSPG
jgi:hypothetical protein